MENINELFDEKPFESAFMFVAPINIPLCILTTAVCFIVLIYYWRGRGTLTNKLFLMITTADLVTCLGHLILMICVVLLHYEAIPPVSATVCLVIHTVMSLLGYASSVFLNMILAVLRTVKISFPFHQVKVGVLKIVIALFFGVLVLFCAADVWSVVVDGGTDCPWHWYYMWENVVLAFIGHNLCLFLEQWVGMITNYQVMIANYQVGLLYLAPIGVVMVCLLVQFSITRIRTRARNPDHPVVTDWSHVNTTVSILSAVFLVCNSGIAVLQIYFQHYNGIENMENPFAFLVCELMISTTLPLMNALLTPLIMISRSQELRGKVMMMIRRTVSRQRQ